MLHLGASAAPEEAGAAESAAGADESDDGVVEPLELPPHAARAKARTAKANAVIFIVVFSGRMAAVCERNCFAIAVHL
jgi:hypothetical protein